MGKSLRLGKTKHNLRYRKNNRIIQRVMIRLNKAHCWHITLKQIVINTKMTKRTLYTHYPDFDHILNAIEQEILAEFKTELNHQNSLLVKFVPDKNHRIIYVTMLFMSKNKDIFVPVCRDVANFTVLYKMVKIIYPMLDITWFPLSSPTPNIGSERVDMYISMCVEILRKWGYKTSCNIHKANRYINRLLRITSEASMRCR